MRNMHAGTQPSSYSLDAWTASFKRYGIAPSGAAYCKSGQSIQSSFGAIMYTEVLWTYSLCVTVYTGMFYIA